MLTFNNLGNLGRLANQMFQYASLKGIARKHGYEYCIPPLEVFGQNDPLVRASELNIYNVFDIGKNNTINIIRNPMLQERMHEFDEELFNSCPDNIDLFGYYQSHQNILSISKMKSKVILHSQKKSKQYVRKCLTQFIVIKK